MVGLPRANVRSIFLRVRFQRGGEQFVTEHRFVRRDATEPISKLSSAFSPKRRPHLEKAIGKAGLKNAARDGQEDHLVAEINALPDLFLAALEQLERFRFLRAETRAAFGAEHFNEP